MEGFVHKAFGPDGPGALEGVVVGQGGDHDDPGLRVLLQDDLGGVQAVHTLHDDVNGHKVGVYLGVPGDGVNAPAPASNGNTKGTKVASLIGP